MMYERSLYIEEYESLLQLLDGHGMELEQLRHEMGLLHCSVYEMPRSRLPEARRLVRQWGTNQCAAEDADTARREMQR